MIKKNSQPILPFDPVSLTEAEVDENDFYTYFPKYLYNPTSLECGTTKYVLLESIQILLRILVAVTLRPGRTQIENLDLHEVEKVYNREAITYDIKHHLTTRGKDSSWRRQAGWFVVAESRKKGGYLSVLDLCTGTGLTVLEMVSSLSHWGIRASVTGLDYNTKMLDIARSRKLNCQDITIRFVRGNAMELVRENAPIADEMAYFKVGSVDVITQVFGVGGISDPISVFNGVLQILSPGGKFLLTDMHQPIAEQAGEWPFLLKWCKFPMLEAYTYNRSTKPIVLNRLWGWRDPTLDYYLLPLIVWEDTANNKWGFSILNFEVESQRWWFGLPLMPVGKIIVEKTRINDEEFEKRRKILGLIEGFLKKRPNA